MKWWPFGDDAPPLQPARGSDALVAMRSSLARQACGDATGGMRALLAAHADIVEGGVEPVIGLDELRRVAACDPDASGISVLAPLAVDLAYVNGVLEARCCIDELVARLADLDKLMEAIR